MSLATTDAPEPGISLDASASLRLMMKGKGIVTRLMTSPSCGREIRARRDSVAEHVCGEMTSPMEGFSTDLAGVRLLANGATCACAG